MFDALTVLPFSCVFMTHLLCANLDLDLSVPPNITFPLPVIPLFQNCPAIYGMFLLEQVC